LPETDREHDAGADLALLREAAREAGRIAMRYFRRSPEVWLKDGHSPVSEADLAVDRYLKDVLLDARPGYGWISEETVDERAPAPRRRVFVVDPIDGTRAYIAGQDQWCVSLAVVEDGRPVAGVLECPAREEFIEARRGLGATQNGVAIHAKLPPEGEALVIGSVRGMADALPEVWRERMTVAPHVPSLAYRIAMVARGDLAGTFVRPNSHDWDLAAADLVLEEAGGAVLAAGGRPLVYGGPTFRHGALVAASGSLLDTMLNIVAAGRLG